MLSGYKSIIFYLRCFKGPNVLPSPFEMKNAGPLPSRIGSGLSRSDPTSTCIKNESCEYQNFEDVGPNPVREVGV